MWFSDEYAAISNAFNFVPYYLFLLLSLAILISPIDPTKAAQDFAAYRLTQFDALNAEYGSRSSILSCDIQTLSSRPYARKCVLMKLADASVYSLRKAIENNAGGFVIMLPSGDWDDASLSHWLILESALLEEEFEVPVYFTTNSDELELMYEKLKNISVDIDKNNGQGLLDTVFSTGYRAYIDAPIALPMRKIELVNIEGKFSSGIFDSKKPTIILTAHYDAGGAIPSLAYGANSNGAGVAVLLEVARILSQLMDSKNSSKYNVMFLLTGGGKVNYLGSKRWLEMMYEDISGIALFDTVEQVINLEGLGVNEGDHLFFHVSRLPKEGTLSHRLLTSLELASKLHPLEYSEPSVEVVHKKINLNQYELAWEHERFALYRIPTATISAWSSPISYNLRNSVLDGGPLHSGSQGGPHGFWGPVQPEVVARNAKVITEALARLIFDISAAEPTALESPFIEPSWSTNSSAAALMDLLTLQPRSTQLLSMPSSRSGSKVSSLSTGSGLINTLEQYMRSFLPEVRLTKHQFAKRFTTGKQDSKSFQQQQQETASTTSMPTLSAAGKDPEVVFYSGVAPGKIIVYRLKSSVFDLVVAFFIGSYLYCLHMIFEVGHLCIHLSQLFWLFATSLFVL
ncbi:unnamed protein product [Hymenolepis diminuta]|uniref:BOS complex subunit NCLN n=1 Tax=Hymenolepis diminuta TaxID=6216 RepID=A0A0R3SQY2_HYMDI|nr:unnamed protein product [Hymenolepis diminuta]